MTRHTAKAEQIREHVDHVERLQLASDPDGQALMRELLNDVEHPNPPSIIRAILDEVIGPDVVRVFRSQTDAGYIVEPQPSAFRMFGRHLQPLTSPDPSTRLKPTVQPAPYSLLVMRDSQLRDLALRGTMLAQNTAGKPLGNW